MDTPVKRCSRCNIEKPLTEYYRQARGKDGLQGYCKLCKRELRAEYRRNHPDRVKIANKKWREKNREHSRQYSARYNAENTEKRKVYRVNNRDKYAKNAALYRARHPERVKYYTRKWRDKNPANMRAMWQRRRARIAGAAGTHTADEISKLFEKQRHKCYYCHKKLINPFTKEGKGEIAHLDHVIPLDRGGRNDIGNLVWACQYCNSSKCNKLPHEWAKGGRLL